MLAHILAACSNKATIPLPTRSRSKFRIYKDFEPIPDRTCFRGSPKGMLERLSHHLQVRQQTQLQQAQEAMWTEAKERVTHLVDRLKDEDTKFKEATLRQVRELVGLLPGWNIGKDARVDEIVEDIKDMLTGCRSHRFA